MHIDTVQSPFVSDPTFTSNFTGTGDFSEVPVDRVPPDCNYYGVREDISVHYDNRYLLTDDMLPELAKIETEFLKNQDRQFDLFCDKNADYGSSNILDGDPTDQANISDSIQRIYIRMQDKMSRLRKLISGDNPSVSTETIVDTFDDIANYANIAIIVHGGKWDGK